MPMQAYANADSGVIAWEATPDAIGVQFADGSVYVYTHDVTGRARVERMKRLARAGKGLATYISQHVGDAYAARFTLEEARESSTRLRGLPDT
jgi:hypothetical protein